MPRVCYVRLLHNPADTIRGINVGLTKMMDQHSTNIDLMYCVCWEGTIPHALLARDRRESRRHSGACSFEISPTTQNLFVRFLYRY